MRRHPYLFIAASLLIACTAAAQDVRVYLTSQAGDRIAEKPSIRFGKGGVSGGFNIDDKVHDQTIVGFGASFLESGAICLNSLGGPRQEEVLRALFDPQKGA